MSNKAIVYASSADQAKMLLSLASGRENEIILIAPENLPDADKLGADMVYLYPADSSAASLPGAIKELAEKEQPELVLCEGGADGKLVAGFAAVALGTSPLCDVNNLTLCPDGVEASRMVYGGSAAAVVSSPFPAVAVVSAGACEAEIPSRSAKLYKLSPVDGALIPCAVESASPAKAVNLGAAKVVVGVGRGISSADNLPLAEKLAEILGAEIGCTRPVSEEEHWYGKERYIGVSGCMIKPNLYFAIGISGQVQHMVGVNQSGTIFALDKSENAPIIKQADYTLIGDVNTALPKLIELLA